MGPGCSVRRFQLNKHSDVREHQPEAWRLPLDLVQQLAHGRLHGDARRLQNGSGLPLLAQDLPERTAEVVVEKVKILLSDLAPTLDGCSVVGPGRSVGRSRRQHNVRQGDHCQADYEQHRAHVGQGLDAPQVLDKGVPYDGRKDEIYYPRENSDAAEGPRRVPREPHLVHRLSPWVEQAGNPGRGR